MYLPLTRHEKGPEGNVLVEGDGSIKGNVLVEEGFSEERYQVSAHGHQNGGEGEHQHTGRSSSDGHPQTGNLSKSR